MESGLPGIWKPAEVADYFGVNEEVVVRELEEGRLRGFRIGSEWRCSDLDLLKYIEGSKPRAMPYERMTQQVSSGNMVTDFFQIEAFDYRWPVEEEHFCKGYETIREINSRHFTFRIGMGEHKVIGMVRPHVVVWLGETALVEFTGGNNCEADGLMASILKLPDGKQLRPNETIPSAYEGFEVAAYNSIVQGPYAFRNMAVIVHKDDLESILLHAIIRAQWKELI